MSYQPQPDALRLAGQNEASAYGYPAASVGYQLHMDTAAELRRLHIEVGQYKAARIGYASEFPVNAEGLPDVENIHRNIRNMKFMRDEQLEALKACLEKGSRWHPCDPVVIQAKSAIAKAIG